MKANKPQTNAIKNENQFLDFFERIGEKALSKWIVLALYFISIVFLASRHEPWGDEYKVWHMTYSMSLGELISAMRVEGHFCLWHLCVLPWVKFFGMDYHAIFVASILLMTVAAWLLLFKVKFSFVGKLFIIFSAPFIYHFPVIARCYALIPPIVIGMVAVYQKNKSPFLFCILLGLLAHTHAYMEGLVAIVWILFVYQYVIRLWNIDTNKAKRNLKASIFTVILVLLAFLQIAGSVVDAGNGVGPAFKSSNSDVYWINYFFSYHRVKFFNTMKLYLWNKIPNFDLSITLFVYVAILWCFFATMQKQSKENRKGLLLIIIVSSLWQILFAINIYAMGFQRVCLVCLPVLFVLGMVYTPVVRKCSTLIVILFWLVNTPCQYVIAKDITHEYNYDARCALEIESIIPDKADLITTGEVSCIRLMKRQIHYIESDSYCLKKELIEYANKATSPSYLITTNELDTMNFDDYCLKPIYHGVEGNDEISNIPYESPFTLYLIEHEKNN